MISHEGSDLWISGFSDILYSWLAKAASSEQSILLIALARCYGHHVCAIAVISSVSLSKQNNKKVETFTLTPHNTQELTSESVQLKLLRGICLSTDILPF